MIATQFNEKMDVTRDAGTTDSDGFTDQDFVNHLTNVPCKIDWSTGAELTIGERITSSRDATIFCSILDITVKDRIEFDSENYDIVSVIKPQNRFMKIRVKRNTEEALV